jgi:hypothetical protein
MIIERPMFPPVDPTRRRFINIAAGASIVSVGSLVAAAAAPAADAELIELGTRFEPLVDRYYVAQRRWSGSLARAHAEHDREFGDPADRKTTSIRRRSLRPSRIVANARAPTKPTMCFLRSARK